MIHFKTCLIPLLAFASLAGCAQAPLTLHSSPEGAPVYVGQNRVGVTPYRLALERDRPTSVVVRRVYEVLPGSDRIEVPIAAFDWKDGRVEPKNCLRPDARDCGPGTRTATREGMGYWVAASP